MDGRSKPGVAKTRMTDTWLGNHRLLYNGATRHPFILSIRDGTVDLSAYKRWLSQAYIFVRAFAASAASVVVKARKHSDERDGDAEVILSCVAALRDEIQWFKQEAYTWGVDLSAVVPEIPTRDYCRFLEGLTSPDVDYTVVMSAFWAIEAVYQESFAHCLEEGSRTVPELREACFRWGIEGLGHYCSSLRNIADRRLEEEASHISPLVKVGEDEMIKAEVTFLSVLQHQVEFWNMSGGVPRHTALPCLEKCDAHPAPSASPAATSYGYQHQEYCLLASALAVGPYSGQHDKYAAVGPCVIHAQGPSQHVAPAPAYSESIAPAASMKPEERKCHRDAHKTSYKFYGIQFNGNRACCNGISNFGNNHCSTCQDLEK